MRGSLLLVLLLAPAPLLAQSSADTLPVRVAEKQIDTFNHRDLDGFMALYADDAMVMEFPSGKVTNRGKASIRERYAPVFKAGTVPPVRVDPRVVNGAFIVENEVWTNPDGTPGQAVWMYEIRGGLIRKAWRVQMP